MQSCRYNINVDYHNEAFIVWNRGEGEMMIIRGHGVYVLLSSTTRRGTVCRFSRGPYHLKRKLYSHILELCGSTFFRCGGRGEGGFAFCWGVELFFKFQVSAHFPWQFCNIITPSPVLSNDQSLSGKLIRVWLWFTELWNIWWWHSGPDQLLMFNDIWHIIWLRERRHVTLTSTWTLFILKCMFHIY